MYLLFKVYSSLWLPTKVWMYVCTRHDIFTSCISKAYFEINRKPLQSGKYSGYISLFLGVKIKTSFLLNVLPVLNFHSNEHQMLERKEKKIAKRNSSVIYSFIHFNVLNVVQVLSTFNIHAKIHSIPLVFTGSLGVDNGDPLQSRMIWGPFWGSFVI